MSSPTVDYAALAKQSGAIGATPAPAQIDYAALAKQSGAVGATAADTGRLALGNTQASGDTFGKWLARQAIGAIPAAGSIAGGLLGGASGGVPGAVAGGALGGGGGESLRQLLVRGIYGKGPETSGQAAAGIGEQAALGGGSELVGPLAARGAKALAGPLAESAVRSYSRALGPTTKFNKAVTADVVPELIQRGEVSATRQGLEKKAAAHLAEVGPKIGAAEAAATTEQIPVKPVLDSIAKARQQFYVAGTPTPVVQPGAAPLIGKLDDLASTVVDASQNGRLSRESARSMRQFLDDQVSKAHGFALTPDEQTVGQLQKLTTDAIRRELNVARPDIAKLNNEYSFWRSVHDVIGSTIERTASQSSPLTHQMGRLGIISAAGAVGGEAVAHVGTGAALGAFIAVAPKVFTSTAWRTVSAVAKDRLAGMLASGQTGKAAVYLAKIAQQQKGAADTSAAVEADR